jgi:hypothetical protein
MSNDEKEVRRVVTLYIDGAGKGNAAQLNEALHSSARWFGTMDGVDYDMDKEGFVAYMVETPGLPSKSEIVAVEMAGTAARVTVKEEGFWGSISFTNFFNLSILDGRWQITNKTFAATGGGHA